jgi:ketosteroid isomerase-like protein
MQQTQRENVEAIRAGVEAFRRGELDEVLAMFDEDVEIYMPTELPNSGTYRGHDGYRKWVAQWLEAWEGFDLEIEQIEPVGQTHVVARTHQTGRGKGSGIPVEMWIAYMWDVRDGKAIAMHLYATVGEAVEVAERREREGSE